MRGGVYTVYILTNWKHTVFYTGITNDLERRVFEHKVKLNDGFTNKYNCSLLMYYEDFSNVWDAIHREKQIKKYRREWKRNMIQGMNPDWKDLSENWITLVNFKPS